EEPDRQVLDALRGDTLGGGEAAGQPDTDDEGHEQHEAVAVDRNPLVAEPVNGETKKYLLHCLPPSSSEPRPPAGVVSSLRIAVSAGRDNARRQKAEGRRQRKQDR